MYYQIQIRRGTASEWTATNPILAAGELAVESDTNKMKVGNGSTAWNSLSYATSTPTQLNLKADLASPTFTGNVVLPSTTSIGTVSATEIGYVDGVTSAIQTQLDSKLTATTASTSNRNKIINGAMQIAQRGTSTASITTSGYYTSDRWRHTVNSHGTWTSTVEADAPSGSGFTNSLKMLCTTAAASPSAGSHVRVGQYTEGFPLQSLAFGSAGAKQITVSFWVKSNVTGTYVLMLYNADPSPNRHCSQSYTINASGTWEKKIITFPADTVGVFHNNNGFSLACDFFIGAGTDRTSGTLQTSWATSVTANEAVGQVNVAAATNNYFQITGIQLEEGAVATPFEFEDYGTTLAKCQRYYNRIASILYTTGRSVSQTGRNGLIHDFPVRMRTAATILGYKDGAGTASRATYHSVNFGNGANHGLTINAAIASDSRCFILTDSYTGFDFYIQDLELGAEL